MRLVSDEVVLLGGSGGPGWPSLWDVWLGIHAAWDGFGLFVVLPVVAGSFVYALVRWWSRRRVAEVLAEAVVVGLLVSVGVLAQFADWLCGGPIDR